MVAFRLSPREPPRHMSLQYDDPDLVPRLRPRIYNVQHQCDIAIITIQYERTTEPARTGTLSGDRRARDDDGCGRSRGDCPASHFGPHPESGALLRDAAGRTQRASRAPDRRWGVTGMAHPT